MCEKSAAGLIANRPQGRFPRPKNPLSTRFETHPQLNKPNLESLFGK